MAAIYPHRSILLSSGWLGSGLRIVLGAGLIGLMTGPAMASLCGEPLPATVDYAAAGQLAGTTLASETFSLVELATSQRFRTGTGVRFTCQRADGVEHAVEQRFTLSDIETVETLDGQYRVNAWADHAADRVTRRARLMLLNGSGRRIHNASCSTASGVCTTRFDLITTATLSDQGLTLRQITYTNGQRTEWVSWQLLR